MPCTLNAEECRSYSIPIKTTKELRSTENSETDSAFLSGFACAGVCVTANAAAAVVDATGLSNMKPPNLDVEDRPVETLPAQV